MRYGKLFVKFSFGPALIFFFSLISLLLSSFDNDLEFVHFRYSVKMNGIRKCNGLNQSNLCVESSNPVHNKKLESLVCLCLFYPTSNKSYFFLYFIVRIFYTMSLPSLGKKIFSSRHTNIINFNRIKMASDDKDTKTKKKLNHFNYLFRA